MSEDNTNPEPNVPDDDTVSKPESIKKQFEGRFGPNNYRENNRYEKEPHFDWPYGSQPGPLNKNDAKTVYEEVVEDLIAIIAKLAKELGKK
jgi:hypothetical protein